MNATASTHLPSSAPTCGTGSGPDSDLDVLVTFRETPGLLRFVDLEDTLSDLLGVPVDLVVEDALKLRIGDRVRREVEPL